VNILRRAFAWGWNLEPERNAGAAVTVRFRFGQFHLHADAGIDIIVKRINGPGQGVRRVSVLVFIGAGRLAAVRDPTASASSSSTVCPFTSIWNLPFPWVPASSVSSGYAANACAAKNRLKTSGKPMPANFTALFLFSPAFAHRDHSFVLGM